MTSFTIYKPGEGQSSHGHWYPQARLSKVISKTQNIVLTQYIRSDGTLADVTFSSYRYNYNKERQANGHIQRKFNVSEREAKRLKVIRDNGSCDICGSKDYLAIDHNHETGAILGILCFECNKRMGWAEASEKWLDSTPKASSYLERIKRLRMP